MLRRTVLALLVLPVLAIACDDDEPEMPSSPLAIYAGEWNGDDALLQGILRRDGNCLYVGDSPRLLVAFASSGTSWDAVNQVITIPGGQLKVGDEIVLGGSQATTTIQWLRPPDSACDQSNIWLSGSG